LRDPPDDPYRSLTMVVFLTVVADTLTFVVMMGRLA
jgi:hypothetical protein